MVITLTIREYVESDREAVLGLVRELQAHESQFFDRMKTPDAIGDWYLEELLKACQMHNGVIMVAEQGFTIVGYAAVLTTVSSEEIVDEISYTFATVIDLSVTEKVRGKGIGTKLLKACEHHARKAGVKWLRLSVLSKNRNAIAVYEKFGFENLLLTMEKPLL